MDRVFLDTNVILDHLLARPPFDADARRFFEKAELGEIELYASALSFCNIAYIVRKLKSALDVHPILTDLSLLVTITPIESATIAQALAAGYKDFEDAVQYQSAVGFGGLTPLYHSKQG
jgi:predicted nucleic acid-binding protein